MSASALKKADEIQVEEFDPFGMTDPKTERTKEGRAAIEQLAWLDEHVLSCIYAKNQQWISCADCCRWRAAVNLLLSEIFGEKLETENGRYKLVR